MLKKICIIFALVCGTFLVANGHNLSEWQTASASHYGQNFSKVGDGRGLGCFSEERIRSGSISLGSSIVKKLKRFKKGGAPIYVQVNDKDINVVTPYGKNIFRVDDKMAKKFCKEDRFYIDFFYKDIDMEHRNLGRFKIKFRVISLG